jgi:myo-inositol-1(or 4)-monophosphatase
VKDPEDARLLEVAVAAAEAGGAHALKNYSRRTAAFKTTTYDIKLELDVECQGVASAVVRKAFPDHAILGEEGGHDADAAGYRWVIDPIDGTVNFSHGLPLWCCSVAVQHRGRTVAGAVRLPMLNELYSASMDSPSVCNGRPISVSSTPVLREAIVYTGVLSLTQDGGESRRVFDRLALEFQKVRILGSAAIELCYVACGRGDAYIETSIHLWDLAAGWLLIERAGGRGESLVQKSPLCMAWCGSNGRIHDDFKRAVAQAING